MGQVSSFYFPVLCLGYRPLPASPLCRIPPYSTEMNPIEQICKQFCSMGFRNEVFKTLKCVVDRLCISIRRITCKMLGGVAARRWIEGPSYLIQLNGLSYEN